MDIRDLELPRDQAKSSRLRMFEIAENLSEDMSLSLDWGHVVSWKDVEKKKEQTSEQHFVNAIINIRMPEMNGDSFENLIWMFEIANGKQPKNYWR